MLLQPWLIHCFHQDVGEHEFGWNVGRLDDTTLGHVPQELEPNVNMLGLERRVLAFDLADGSLVVEEHWYRPHHLELELAKQLSAHV